MENRNNRFSRFIDAKVDTNFKEAGVYDWIGSDNEKWFSQNITRRPDLLQTYIDNPIKYDINKQGFRSKFDFEPYNNRDVDLALGCSHTFGVGHYLENTWVDMLSKATGREIINLGSPGHGIEVHYINACKYTDYFENVKNVFLYQPVYNRYHYFHYVSSHGGDFTHCSAFDYPGLESGFKLKYNSDYVNRTLTKDYMFYVHFRMADAIEGLCHRKGINLISIFDEPTDYGLTLKKDLEDGPILKKPKEGDLVARDFWHYPKSSNIEIFNWFNDKLK